MRAETILSAMVKVVEGAREEDYFDWQRDKCRRQFAAFRDRILRVDAEKDRQIAIREEDKWNLKDEIAYYKGQLTAKDLRIAELERELRAFNRPFVDPSVQYDLTNEEWSKQ